MKCNGGYVLIDCGGMDLTKLDTTQTIEGLYAKCLNAFSYNKPIYGFNMIYGTVGQVSPVPVFATIPEEGKVCLTSSVLQIFVTSSDVVTINSMILS